MTPATHRALTVTSLGKAVVQEKPVPRLHDDSILIKVRAVSLNPTDWKHIDYLHEPGNSVGCDFAGDVVEVGAKAAGKGIKIGDAVAGFIRGGVPYKDNGVYQEYVRSYPELVWKKPASLSYEAAAPMGGIALSTAAQALYHRLKLPTPWNPATESFPILIWAGSTAVGIYAIQLAKASGLRVATTASPKNFDLLRKLGADVVFDYKDSNAPAKIKEWSEGKIEYALDTISEQGSADASAKAFGSKGGKLVTLLPYLTAEGGQWPENVEVLSTLVYSAIQRPGVAEEAELHIWSKTPWNPTLKSGQKFFRFPDEPLARDYHDMVEWNKHVPALIEAGKLGEDSIPLKRWPGGLDAALDALDYLRQGKVSAEKVILSW